MTLWRGLRWLAVAWFIGVLIGLALIGAMAMADRLSGRPQGPCGTLPPPGYGVPIIPPSLSYPAGWRDENVRF